MARRKFRRRFRAGPPVKRQKRVWTSAVFIESAVSNTALNEFVVFDVSQLESDAPSFSREVDIRRIIGNFVHTITPQSTTLAFEQYAVFWAVYVIDREDATDTTLLTTGAGDLLEGGVKRLLRTGCYGGTAIEVPAATQGTAFYPGHHIEFDLKVPMSISFDEQVVFGMQMSGDPSAAIIDMRMSGLSRVLMVD